MRVSRGELRDEGNQRVVTLCVRRVLPPHTIAALFRRTFQFTNALVKGDVSLDLEMIYILCKRRY